MPQLQPTPSADDFRERHNYESDGRLDHGLQSSELGVEAYERFQGFVQGSVLHCRAATSRTVPDSTFAVGEPPPGPLTRHG